MSREVELKYLLVHDCTAKQRGDVTEPWTYLSNSCGVSFLRKRRFWQATGCQFAALAKFDVVIAPPTCRLRCMSRECTNMLSRCSFIQQRRVRKRITHINLARQASCQRLATSAECSYRPASDLPDVHELWRACLTNGCGATSKMMFLGLLGSMALESTERKRCSSRRQEPRTDTACPKASKSP